MDVPLLREFIILLAAAIGILFLSRKLKLPTIVGFLLTGIVIGPSGLGLIHDADRIDVLAEIGVVMLLFTIGLDLSLERLSQIKKTFWLGGGLQVAGTTAATTVVLFIFGIPLLQAVFFGFLVSLSSTAVVLQSLLDRGEAGSPFGRVALGILLFQDFAIAPMIVLTPLLGRSDSSLSLVRIVERAAFGAAIITGVVLAARFLLPRFLHAIVRTRVRETFLMTTLFICLGASLLTSSLGFSLALGAFLAGIIISESEYSHQVAADIMPFKDLFNSIFFISVGMLLNLKVIRTETVFILGLVLSLFVLKFAIVFLTVKILRQSSPVALRVGLSLAQIGEFSFVLAAVGRTVGLLPDRYFQGFIASSILTIFATPFLIRFSAVASVKSEKVFRPNTAGQPSAGRANELTGHVIIAGYGLNGRNLARVLKETGIPYIVLELNPDSVREAREDGEIILFGDVSSRVILEAASLAKAKMIVFAISDPQTTRRAVRIARHLNNAVRILVRTRSVAEIEELYRLGADQVIPEEFETSIEIFTRTLEEYHVPRNLTEAQIKIIRSENYGMMRGAFQTGRSLEKIAEYLSAGTVETFYIRPRTVAVGRTISELRLRSEAGATIVAMVRQDQTFSSPSPDFRLEEGDILILSANHQDMDRAFRFLERALTPDKN